MFAVAPFADTIIHLLGGNVFPIKREFEISWQDIPKLSAPAVAGGFKMSCGPFCTAEMHTRQGRFLLAQKNQSAAELSGGCRK
jgi:hypothetical protein